MYKGAKRVLALMIGLVTVTGLLGGCGKKKGGEGEEEKPTSSATVTETEKEELKPSVVRIGTHNLNIDPNYKDPVTGLSTALPSRVVGTKMAIEACKKDLNVDIKYVKYPGYTSEVILKSVLAGDPICDFGWIAGGMGPVISQNVLQNLDAYADYFKDPEYQWMLPGKIYGHYYTLNWEMEFTRGEVLSYNISYLKNVPSLKENGKTVLPTDLWKSGKWTWSAFEDYLTKVNSFYANKKAPVRNEVLIVPYATDIKFPVLAAIKSTGESVFGADGIGIASDDTKRAVDFIYNLYSKKLIVQLKSTGQIARMQCMRDGECVFTNLANNTQPSAAEGLTKRGESMGVVPFPRPDDMDAKDPKYMQVVDCPGAVGVVKGISKEQTDITIKAFRLYADTLFKGRTGATSVPGYFKDRECAKNEAVAHGFDAINEDYGQDIVDAYMAYNPNLRSTEGYGVTGWKGKWEGLVRASIMGTNGSPQYETAIESRKQEFIDEFEEVQNILSTDKIVDNILPKIELVGKDIALAKGTDAAKVDWSTYIKATDNIDGDIDIKNVTIDTANIKFDTVGKYDKGLVASVKDKEGNERVVQFNVVVFDPDNKEAPQITVKESYRKIKKDEDASKINWGKDFIEKAQSADGFDVKNYITADISSLDVTKAGKYDVTITVTDYAGNKAEQKISVEVA